MRNLRKTVSYFLVFSFVICFMPAKIAKAAEGFAATGKISGITETTADVDGTAYSEPAINTIERGIEYSLTSNFPDNPAYITAATTESRFAVRLTGLQANSDYYVRAYVKYKDDNGAIKKSVGETVYFKTDASYTNGNNGTNAISITVPTFEGSSISDALCRSTYSSSGHSFEITSAGFVYSDSTQAPVLGSTSYNVEAQTSASSGSIYQRITGLQDKVYYVRAYVTYKDNGVIKYKYSDISRYAHTGSTTGAVVTTNSASYSNLKIKADATISNYSSSNIQERGFVYSNSTTEPNIDNASKIVISTDSQYFNSEWSVDANTTLYYVRAYVKTSNGYIYANTIKVEVGSLSPIIYTKSINNVTVSSAEILIDVVRSGHSSIIERGAVYSDSSQTPELSSSNTKYRSIGGGVGEGTVKIESLSANRKYYVRAYARNSEGTSYGEVKEFFTINSNSVVTKEPSNIRSNAVVANGNVTDIDSSKVLEKGFVYSTTEVNPTVDNQRISATSTGTGDYSMEITGLTKDNNYNLRSYIKTEQGYIYGNVIKFKTNGEEVAVTITYRLLNGSAVGTQDLRVMKSRNLIPEDLTIPSGYKIQNLNWNYTVYQNDSITVVVEKINNATTPINPSPDTETAFMEGIGSGMFGPDKATSRVEVAKVIYNLAVDKNSYVKSGMSFTDVPPGFVDKAAIEYVSSKGYMSGYPDGTFKPTKNITRAEVCRVLESVYSLTGATTVTFNDVSQSFWAYKFIGYAASNKMIYGYPDGSFKPNNDMTRAEVVTLFCNAAKRSLQPLGISQFSDVPATHWAYKYVMNAAVPY